MTLVDNEWPFVAELLPGDALGSFRSVALLPRNPSQPIKEREQAERQDRANEALLAWL
jgi:hypothetical protein